MVEQASIAFSRSKWTGTWRSRRRTDPEAVPALFLIGDDGRVRSAHVGFNKDDLNAMAARMGRASRNGGETHSTARLRASRAAASRRHRESSDAMESAEPLNLARRQWARARRASRCPEDPYEYCRREFGDPLPVVPPTVERVERMMDGARSWPEVIARIPPCQLWRGDDREDLAANAVMAGCAAGDDAGSGPAREGYLR